jgi:hypothetical protein
VSNFVSVSTDDNDEQTIREYIQSQEKEGRMLEQLKLLDQQSPLGDSMFSTALSG